MIAVIGAGKSGISVANHAAGKGEKVLLFDEAASESFKSRVRKRLSEGVELVQGMVTADVVNLFEYAVVSPGVPLWKVPLAALEKQGVEVMGEVEYAFRNLEGTIIAVTGTNGKSTVTTLIGMMMSNEMGKVFAGGNLNDPLTLACGKDFDCHVVELSSFQLETTTLFRPDVGVLLNIGEDHMDRYDHFDEYVEAKGKIFRNQGGGDFAVYNPSDELTRQLAGNSRGRKYGFSATYELSEGAWVKEGRVIIRAGQIEREIDIRGCFLEGLHNLENVAAAALTASLAGAGPGSIKEAIDAFRGLPHRMEYSGTIRGVDYFNDSKGTNVHALRSALGGVERDVILIAGGKDKGLSFVPALDLMRKRVRCVFLIGEAAPRIMKEVEGHVPCELVDSLDEAVHGAYESARAGDMVLFSPACSSFDMFENFEERGEAFKQAVLRLSPIEQKN